MYACKNGQIKVVKLILFYSETKNIFLNMRDSNEIWTAFMYACHFGHTDVVKLMLSNQVSKGIHLNSKDQKRRTAFMLACCNGQVDVVQLLMDTNMLSNCSWTIPKELN